MFDGFTPARRQFATWQSAQRVGINQNQAWLMKSAHEILSHRQVHCRLAADRSVNLREQSCGHLDKINTAQIRRCGKSCQVANNTAAKSDDRIVPFEV